MTSPPRGAGRASPDWLLPGELAGDAAGRRTVRDWTMDGLLFGAAALVGLSVWDGYPPYYADAIPAWMLAVDPWVGAAACLALWWRRRFPMALAVALVPALLVAGTAVGATMVAVLNVAVRRDRLPATLVTAAYLAPAATFGALHPTPGTGVGLSVAVVGMMYLVPLGWGVATRARRQLILSLWRDAERERQEHRRRLADARRGERERIAREMHDVLAHRISLLSVHAGGLAYRTAQAEAGVGRPLDAAEIGRAAEVIRDAAGRALDELGEVLAVLRTGDDEAQDRVVPQPRLADIPRLVTEARAAGQRVSFEMVCAPGATEALRPATQRTVYRTVQEGLTNARKHAPGARVTVRVDAAPHAGVVATVVNPLPGVPADDPPGTGAGLAGLAERVAVDGGTIEHGVADGSFRLAVRLSWPA
ncbi:Signal transduction histidine kinase [Micromonospora citrea]|uniref:histidine kinase n=1 Tax=Micromonospora citrea TaxID=47855 RepID=A0A1C6W2D3_9ACTN|nr:histidine kinase [Micromonospora citrea]SCL72733.1 Signal transduction histidine kinase [Micromonospora citrea]